MFGSLGIPELLFIFAIALLIFGPKRLPDVGRTLGKAMREFRKATNEFRFSVENEMRLDEPHQAAPPAKAASGAEPRADATPAEPVSAVDSEKSST